VLRQGEGVAIHFASVCCTQIPISLPQCPPAYSNPAYVYSAWCTSCAAWVADDGGWQPQAHLSAVAAHPCDMLKPSTRSRPNPQHNSSLTDDRLKFEADLEGRPADQRGAALQTPMRALVSPTNYQPIASQGSDQLLKQRRHGSPLGRSGAEPSQPGSPDYTVRRVYAATPTGQVREIAAERGKSGE
jgi:hypothetical protein